MDDKEIISELTLQVRSLTERIQQLTDMLLGINPVVQPPQQQDSELRPIHRKSQFRQLITLADKANRTYWEEQAKRAADEVIRAKEEQDANKDAEAIRNGGGGVIGTGEGSNADESGTGNDGQNASQETSEIRQGIGLSQEKEIDVGSLVDYPKPNE